MILSPPPKKKRKNYRRKYVTYEIYKYIYPMPLKKRKVVLGKG
jgi:hypothetical protein